MEIDKPIQFSKEDLENKMGIEKNLVPLFQPNAKLFIVVRNILAKSLTAPAKALANFVCAIYLLDGGKSEQMRKYISYFMTDTQVVPKVVVELLYELSQVSLVCNNILKRLQNSFKFKIMPT